MYNAKDGFQKKDGSSTLTLLKSVEHDLHHKGAVILLCGIERMTKPQQEMLRAFEPMKCSVL